MILETTIRATLHNLTPEAESALAQTARIFQSARRTAYQRLKDGLEPSAIDHSLRVQFGMDARYARDAVLEAEAAGHALRELLPQYLAGTEAKIRKVEKRLQRCRQKQSSTQITKVTLRQPFGGVYAKRDAGRAQDKAQGRLWVIAGLEHRLAKLQAKRAKWQKHLAEGTLPPVIFGSAEAFHARRLGEMSPSEWQARRRAQFWSRGESPRGNQHAGITANDDRFSISLATLPAVNGKLRYFSGDLWVPNKQRDLLRRSLDKAYSVRVMHSNNTWHVHITVREEVAGEIVQQAPLQVRVGGMDCNTDCLTVAVASPQGNLLARHTVWMRDLDNAQSDAAEHIISTALDEALDFLKRHAAGCLVVEQLKFAQDHDTLRTFNRRTTRFRSTMVELAIRKALRRGLAVAQVNPAYSSIIGKFKYAETYGLSTHEAAAFVLARRGQKRDERLPGHIVAQFPRLRERLIAEANAKPAKDKLRYVYLKWADKLSTWKEQPSWSLWSIWDKASDLSA
jgi:hypothetical protein